MIRDNDSINNTELGIFLFFAMIGIGILGLPSRINQYVNQDAWIVLFAALGLSILMMFILCKLGERHQELGFVGTLRFLFGNIIGTILAVPLLLYSILFMGLESRMFGEVTKLYLLHKTPLEFIIFPLILLVVVLVRKGIEGITRTFGILIFIVGVAGIGLIIASMPNMDLSNLRPMATQQLTQYASGSLAAFYGFSGLEIMLIIFPFLKKPAGAFKTGSLVLIITALFSIIITIQCIAGLGNEETKSLVWPVMALTKSISIPGGFIEDIEGVLAALWVIYAFASLCSFMFLYTVILGDLFQQKANKHFVSMSIPILYLVSLQGNSIPTVFKISDAMNRIFSTYSMIGLPILMLSVSYLRGKKKKS